jgi:hypothetical protein
MFSGLTQAPASRPFNWSVRGFRSAWTQHECVVAEISLLQLLLVLQAVLVDCPEVGLEAGRFGPTDRGAGTRMDLLQRKVPDHEPKFVWELALQRVHAVAPRSGIKSFVVAVVHQCRAGMAGTRRVILRCNRRCKRVRDYSVSSLL